MAEASRVLRPNGRLVVIDFAAHSEEKLRTKFNHHRLGFTDGEMSQYFGFAGFDDTFLVDQLVGDPLTVKFWLGRRRRDLQLVSTAEVG